jgi:hypothetical protein
VTKGTDDRTSDPTRSPRPEPLFEPSTPSQLGVSSSGLEALHGTLRHCALQYVPRSDEVRHGDWAYARRIVACCEAAIRFFVLRPVCFDYLQASPLDGTYSPTPSPRASRWHHVPALGTALVVSVVAGPSVRLAVPITFRTPWLWIPTNSRLVATEAGAEKADGVVVMHDSISCGLPLLLRGQGQDTPSLPTMILPERAAAKPAGIAPTTSPSRDSAVTPRQGALAATRRRRRTSLGLGGMTLSIPPPPAPPLSGWRLVVDIAAAAPAPLLDGRLAFLTIPPISLLTRGRGAGQPKRQSIYVGGVAVADIVEGHMQVVVPSQSSFASNDFRRGDETKPTNRVVLEFLIGGDGEDMSVWGDVMKALLGSESTPTKSAAASARQRPHSANGSTGFCADAAGSVGREKAHHEDMPPLAPPSTTPRAATTTTAAARSTDAGADSSNSNTPRTTDASRQRSLTKTASANGGSGNVPASMLVKAVLSRIRFFVPDPADELMDPQSSDVNIKSPTAVSAATAATAATVATQSVAPIEHRAFVALQDTCGNRSGVVMSLFAFKRETTPLLLFQPLAHQAGMEPFRRLEIAMRPHRIPSVLQRSSLACDDPMEIIRPFDGVRMRLSDDVDGGETVQHVGGCLFVTAANAVTPHEGFEFKSASEAQWLGVAPDEVLRVVSTPVYGEVPSPGGGGGLTRADDDFGLNIDPSLAEAAMSKASGFGSLRASPSASQGGSGPPAHRRFQDTAQGCVLDARDHAVAVYRITPSSASIEIRLRCRGPAATLSTPKLISNLMRLIVYRLPAVTVEQPATDRTLTLRVSRGNALRVGSVSSPLPAPLPLLWSDFGCFNTAVGFTPPLVVPGAQSVEVGYVEVVEGAPPIRPLAAMLDAHRNIDDVITTGAMCTFAVAVAGAAVEHDLDQLSVKKADDLTFGKSGPFTAEVVSNPTRWQAKVMHLCDTLHTVRLRGGRR